MQWLGIGFVVLAALLVPWSIYLALELPTHTLAHHYDLAWVGFDAALTAALLAVGVLVHRGSARTGPLASAAGTLLLVDAWFDVVTAAPGSDRWEAVTMAVLVELPLAAICWWLAAHVQAVIERRLRWIGRRPTATPRVPAARR